MSYASLSLLDWVIIVAYFLVVAGIGYWAARKVKNTNQYFLGQRGFGKWLMMAQSFGVGTHAEQPVALAASVYKSGFAGIWYQWKNMFVTPFYWIMAPLFRRCGRTTISEVVEDRYGSWMGAFYVLFALVSFTMSTGVMLKGAGKLIYGATDKAIPINTVIIVMAVIFVLYSFHGGLLAAAWTDFFQSFLILALSFMLIPVGWKAAGGLQGIIDGVKNPLVFSLSTPQDVTPGLILILTLNGLIGIMAQPHIIASVGTGKGEHDCRVGFTYGNFVKRFCTIGWAFCGIIALAIFTGDQKALLQKEPDATFGLLCHRLMFPGALGLLIASVLAANMSTCSAFMVDAGAIFTRGFYDRFLVRGKSDQHYLWVGKISGFIVILISIIYAIFFVDSIIFAFLFTETFATYFGIAILGGFVWRRATRWGAIASFFTSLGVNFVMHWMMLETSQRFAFKAVMNELQRFDPQIFLNSMGGGIAAFVIVSLLTKPEGKNADALFDRLKTPPHLEGTDPKIAEEKSAKEGDQLLLPNLLRLREGAHGEGVFNAYRKDLSGFAMAWVVVAGMIGLAWVLLSFFK
jgi:Na+/proline symporter